MTDVCISPADTPARPSSVFESALLPLLPPLRFSSAEFSPHHISVTREPLHPSLLHSIIIQRCHKHPHTHTQAANIQIQLMEHPGRRANIKMDEQDDRFGLQRRQVYFFVNGEAIKTQTFFQGGLSLMGRVKSQKESLFPHTHRDSACILTCRNSA